ncbi:MAG: indolepyruvate ferredoxin oxidoreductase, alpha subunit [Gammaproteobacteria bacterium]|jgi:indolepyruvate ferredoxin oxidoreductase alpha subunit|nr:indolepyruvate ferredoxin oxidoreductase, alpha subunit [Gammaproteobacteria bacterium]
MAERSFAKEVETLRLGAGDEFHGEGILAVTKALLQSGVAYVGGYQGAPVSHLMDVLADAEGILNDLGVHFEASASEATAAAMLSASINYPLRGAVTWKSTVGTNVASDALANLASSGVMGGALIILGEDYGEGASIMQERTHAFAMKSQMWLLDPRPQLPAITAMVEKGFELSEASSTPVMLMLRIRACHVYGVFPAKDNRRPAFSAADALAAPSRDYGKIILPPSTFAQEKEKVEKRLPAAVQFIAAAGLNEFIDGDAQDVGIVMQGGLYNNALRAMELLGCADTFGNSGIPLYVLNATYPLIPAEWVKFCSGKRAVLVVEEGQPEFIEQAATQILHQAGVSTRIVGKESLPRFGEYTVDALRTGISAFIDQYAPQLRATGTIPAARKTQVSPEGAAKLAALVPPRPSGLCTGCPERPFFAAMKILQKETGPLHISADIGCHSFATLPPFNMGNSIMGYGLGAAGASAFGTDGGKRAVAVMGDGGFWHNGLTSGIGNAVFNKHDDLTIIIDNGYAAATGGQDIPSSRGTNEHRQGNNSIVDAVKGVGVKWVKRTHTYDMQGTLKLLREALKTPFRGPKVIVADGECQLNRQRRVKPIMRKAIKDGQRVVRERFGVDPDTCTGDHSCIRLSGCPSLTVKDNPDPLRTDPVAHVDNSCVGCGVCGEVAHAAVLCPSFYRAELVYNPSRWDRFMNSVRCSLIGALQRRSERNRLTI